MFSRKPGTEAHKKASSNKLNAPHRQTTLPQRLIRRYGFDIIFHHAYHPLCHLHIQNQEKSWEKSWRRRRGHCYVPVSPSQVAKLNNALLPSHQTGNVFFLTSFFSVVPVVLPCVLAGPPWPPRPLAFASITVDEPDSHNYTPLTLIMRSLSWRLARHLFWFIRPSSQLSGQSGKAGADPPLG